MFPTTLLTTLLLALSVAATPVVQVRKSYVTLPLSRRVNTTSTHNLLKHDLQRVKALKARAKAASGADLTFEEAAIVNEPVDNQAVTYIASVGVGSPATTYDLIIDTGSSNTWVGAGTTYATTSTSVKTSNKVSVTYGSGSFSGTEYTDTVTIGSLAIPGQSIGVASTSSGFDGTDGILGIGPVGLTQGTLSPATSSLIPTVTDNLYSQGSITANEIGVSFEPTTSTEVLNGELTWGGTDSSKYTGSLSYTPLTTVYPSSYYWGIDQSVRYGTSTILSSTAGIVDTGGSPSPLSDVYGVLSVRFLGTTLVLLASDAVSLYQSATGAVLDSTTGLLSITAAQYANLESLFFTTNGVTYELTANAQIWPRALNTAIGGSSGSIYLVVADIGSTSGSGLDFINGYTFLERFYSVYDTTNERVGFATTPFTAATTN
ncbi:aspartic peptidase A1 [Macrolepiota fuliginosa MF-IS2]|uniref:Aspartic peptidase A1 n=1 Tax=Macrolepiota fuliginosa MF-IS2 TaxID=1400762 RepID=A0A9P5XNS3_9AGAR|nr:aspartic peptidase A1 [Macrolepiota fuliginosa MF-IS2]